MGDNLAFYNGILLSEANKTTGISPCIELPNMGLSITEVQGWVSLAPKQQYNRKLIKYSLFEMGVSITNHIHLLWELIMYLCPNFKDVN